MSDESYPVNPTDDPPSGTGFGSPAPSGAGSSSEKIRLEAISLQDLLDKQNSYLWTCYFVVAEKRDGSRPDLPVVIGVFRINGAPNPGTVEPDLQAQLGGLTLERIAQLLSLFTFELFEEDAAASIPRGKYSLNLKYSPVTGKDTGPNGGKVDSPHGDSSLLDIAFLLQNFQITVSPGAGGSYGPYQTIGGSTNLRHANVELGLAHGPMTLDCVVSLLSLLDWNVGGMSVGADGVEVFVGGKVTVCYTNKSHTG